jgi:hypothetical protein
MSQGRLTPYILANRVQGCTRGAMYPDDFGNALGCRHTHRVAADLRGPLFSKCSSVWPLADGLPSGTRKPSCKPGAGFTQCRHQSEIGAVERLHRGRHLINAQAARLGNLANSDMRIVGLIEQANDSRQHWEIARLPAILHRDIRPVGGVGVPPDG